MIQTVAKLEPNALSSALKTDTYDPAGRLAQIQSSGTNLLTINSNNYNSAYLPTLATYGNGVQATFSYNSRLQLSSIAYAQGSSTYFSQNYSYTSQGVPGNNGQIQSITDNVDSTRSTAYTYDAWSRLKTATNAQWGLTYTYDRYGNRKSQSAPVLNNVTPDPYTNRLLDTGYTYDAAGNMTADGLNSLTYDAENHLVTNTQAGVVTNYAYDGNGLRVKKCAPNCSSPTSSTVYIFSGSKVIAEYDNGAAPNSPSREYIYAGSQLLAKIEGSATKYYHQDHLSNRLITDSSGNVAEQKGHFPFGEDWYQGADKLKFTTYERDSESGNDFAMARYHVNRLARFSSPDPVAGSLADPQSLNRYAYVLNDPINLADPSGLDPFQLQPSSAVQIRIIRVPRSTTFLAFLPPVDLLRLLYAEFAPGWFAAQGPARVNGTLEPPNVGPPQVDPTALSKLIPPPMLPPPPDPNACDPMMIAAFNRIWADTMHFPTQQREAYVVVDQAPSGWSFTYGTGPIVNPRVEVPHADVPIHPGATVAIAHTHPGTGTPSVPDRRSPVPNFVVSQFQVVVTDPNNPTPSGDRTVRRSDWARPCLP
jgi:RHS repeat-associated protein